METLAIIINMIWLWACLAPALLIIAIFLIRVGLRSVSSRPVQVQGHKHNWIRDDKGSTVDIPPVKPNPKHDVGTNPKAWPSDWFAIYRDKYNCDCGEEKTETHRDLY